MAALKDKTQKEILASLKSKDEKIVLQALKNLKNDGQDEIIPHLVDLMISTKNDKLKEELQRTLFELKSSNSVKYIAEALENEKYVDHYSTLVSIFWQAGLDASSAINTLTQVAITGDYMTCFEVLTVLEECIETKPEDEQIASSISKIKEETAKKNEKEELYKTMLVILQDIMIG